MRRLRDYVQRCVSGYPDPVDLDMAPEDVAVLVACCRYYFDVIDRDASGSHPSPLELQRNFLAALQKGGGKVLSTPSSGTSVNYRIEKAGAE